MKEKKISVKTNFGNVNVDNEVFDTGDRIDVGKKIVEIVYIKQLDSKHKKIKLIHYSSLFLVFENE